MSLIQQKSKKSSLFLTELFVSVQGESSLIGLPTTFIRLSACNLRCSWCDSTYSFKRGSSYEIEEIIQEVKDFGAPYICVTGGEPLLQKPVYPLMKALCDEGYNVSIETSGSLPTTDIDPRVRIILDVKCPGSEMEEKNDWTNLDRIRNCDEVKFVLLNREDYEYAKNICIEHHLFHRAGEVLFSPVHGELDNQALVQWILEDRLPVRLNLQIHKFIWTPETKGV
ncbi:MAG: 7-carboxy-7-deazaguanine synthase QueE [Waddliaceae bacterium]|nr:7-carboxy-7-deazaguanine synthase QueE [Waddliaceae bacterium]